MVAHSLPSFLYGAICIFIVIQLYNALLGELPVVILFANGLDTWLLDIADRLPTYAPSVPSQTSCQSSMRPSCDRMSLSLRVPCSRYLFKHHLWDCLPVDRSPFTVCVTRVCHDSQLTQDGWRMLRILTEAVPAVYDFKFASAHWFRGSKDKHLLMFLMHTPMPPS